MPMLALTISGRPSATNGCCRSCSTLRAASSARFTSVAGNSTANSSPPRRATVSDARKRAAQARRHFLQNQIAGVMAERVVDLLEAVEIDQQHGEALLIAMRAQDRLLQPIEEQRAIGKIGERVVIGQVGDALIGQVTLAPDRRFAQLALDGRSQPREVALHDVVLGAGPHRGDGGVFADGSRDEDERQIGMLLAHDGERLGAAEARHRVVGDHEIPVAIVELAAERLGSCRRDAQGRRNRRASAPVEPGPHRPQCPRLAKAVTASSYHVACTPAEGGLRGTDNYRFRGARNVPRDSDPAKG